MSSPQWKSPVQDSAILATPRSFSFSGTTTHSSRAPATGPRDTGIIEKLMHSYGFIQCRDQVTRLFFHYSQFSGDVEYLKLGDTVEFAMSQDRKTGKPIAIAIVKVSSTIVSFPTIVRDPERVSGTVTTEIKHSSNEVKSSNGTPANKSVTAGRITYENRGECFFLPYTVDDLDSPTEHLKAGDKVTFQIERDQTINHMYARHVRLESIPQRHQGVISSLRDNFGFIERSDVVKEIFFHVSEAKCFHDLVLGEDVEFDIQTRNGKEVGVNVTQLPEGAVIFEDIGTEKLKGEVVRAIERHVPQSGGRRSSDPLPGRIRYRRAGTDPSSALLDLEAPFGEKDVLVDFTVAAKDWVQFNLATDRRDCMLRATNVEVLVDESLLVSGEVRETGAVAALKEGFGFIRCKEREARMFFHYSELLDPSHDLQLHDELEFTVVQDAQNSTRQNAIRIRSLPRGSVKFETVSKEPLTGVVEREPSCLFSNNRSPAKVGAKGDEASTRGSKGAGEMGVIAYEDESGQKHATIQYQAAECDPRNSPKVGDKVQFNISENKSNGNGRVACDVKVLGRGGLKNGLAYTHRGYVAALKDGFGFIETADHDREVFFHFSVYEGDVLQLELGQEVEYAVAQKNAKVSAESVRRLPEGSIPPDVIRNEVLEGIVTRPVRCFNPEQDDYSGLIRVGSEDADDAESYEFGITSLNEKREFLQKGDPVQFRVGVTQSTGKERAVKVMALRKKLQATVESIKGHFGFLSHEVEDNKKLFFHMTEVKDGAVLQTGDTVEFVIIHNQRNGRYSACNVVRVTCNPSATADTRPRHMIDRFRTISLVDEGGPRLVLLRQPRGPDGTDGFKQPRTGPLKTLELPPTTTATATSTTNSSSSNNNNTKSTKSAKNAKTKNEQQQQQENIKILKAEAQQQAVSILKAEPSLKEVETTPPLIIAAPTTNAGAIVEEIKTESVAVEAN